MSYDPKSLSKDPEKNWKNAVDCLWKTFEQCKNADEFNRTYIIVHDCIYDWLAKLNISRHMSDIFNISMDDGDMDAEMERHGHAGWKNAFGELRFQVLAQKYRLPNSEYQRLSNEYKSAESTAKIVSCSTCNFAIPLIKGFEIKVCPCCGKPWQAK